MAGTKIPLRIFNASGVARVGWFFDGARIQAGSDGFYTVTRSGMLKAEIFYEDGSSELIVKQIRIK